MHVLVAIDELDPTAQQHLDAGRQLAEAYGSGLLAFHTCAGRDLAAATRDLTALAGGVWQSAGAVLQFARGVWQSARGVSQFASGALQFARAGCAPKMGVSQFARACRAPEMGVSQSARVTVWPCSWSQAAKWTERVLFPTPPLLLATTIIMPPTIYQLLTCWQAICAASCQDGRKA